MAQPRFLLDEPLTGPGEYTLGREESHHAASVMRCRRDDVIVVFDGRGNYAEAVITDARREAVRVRVDGAHAEEHLPLTLTIATAIPKGKRWQSLVEKCTELGADWILPMLLERSVAKGEGDAEKWRRWAVEAAKQSRRAWIPEIALPMPIADILAIAKRENALLFVADAGGESPATFYGLPGHALHVMVLIGPEGGFTAEELAGLARHGAKAIRLSPFILRIETAAAAACTVFRELV